MKTVPEMLRDLGDVYEERNKLYGDNYKHFGEVMVAQFPEGLTLKTVADWNRVALFIWMQGKLTRYAMQFEQGGHADSLDDNAVYSQMLRELDGELAERAAAVRYPRGGVVGVNLEAEKVDAATAMKRDTFEVPHGWIAQCNDEGRVTGIVVRKVDGFRCHHTRIKEFTENGGESEA